MGGLGWVGGRVGRWVGGWVGEWVVGWVGGWVGEWVGAWVGGWVGGWWEGQSIYLALSCSFSWSKTQPALALNLQKLRAQRNKLLGLVPASS